MTLDMLVEWLKAEGFAYMKWESSISLYGSDSERLADWCRLQFLLYIKTDTLMLQHLGVGITYEFLLAEPDCFEKLAEKLRVFGC